MLHAHISDRIRMLSERRGWAVAVGSVKPVSVDHYRSITFWSKNGSWLLLNAPQRREKKTECTDVFGWPFHLCMHGACTAHFLDAFAVLFISASWERDKRDKRDSVADHFHGLYVVRYAISLYPWVFDWRRPFQCIRNIFAVRMQLHPYITYIVIA